MSVDEAAHSVSHHPAASRRERLRSDYAASSRMPSLTVCGEGREKKRKEKKLLQCNYSSYFVKAFSLEASPAFRKSLTPIISAFPPPFISRPLCPVLGGTLRTLIFPLFPHSADWTFQGPNVVVDMKLMEAKDVLPEGYTLVEETLDTSE